MLGIDIIFNSLRSNLSLLKLVKKWLQRFKIDILRVLRRQDANEPITQSN